MPKWQDWFRYRVQKQDANLDMGSILPVRVFQACIFLFWMAISIKGVSSNWFGWFANGAFSDAIGSAYLITILGLMLGYLGFVADLEWKHRRMRRRLEQTVNFPDEDMQAFRLLNKEKLKHWKVKFDDGQHQRN